MRKISLTLCILFAVTLSSNTVFGQHLQRTYENYSRYAGEKNWIKAKASVDTLLMRDPKNNYWLVSKAEVESQLENRKVANEYLEKSIKNGYLYLDEIIHDENLKNIRSTAKYASLINDLEKTLSTFKLQDSDQRIVIDVPPLMECYAIMLYLGNPRHTLINDKQNHSYFRSIDSYFNPYKNNKLVKELANTYPSDDHEWINNLRAHHNIRTLYVYDSLNINDIKRFPIELDTDLAKLVRDFAIESDFMKFYESNLEFYEAMKKIMYTNYSFGSHVIPFFNANFDMRINRFNIYFSPIYGGWQHGPVARQGNYIECFYFGGIMYTDTKEFYYPDVNLLFTFLTEFDHTPVNALTDSYKNEIQQYKDKVTLLNNTGHVSYGAIVSTIEEYITWAFALQYFYENTPGDYARLERNIVFAMEKGRGFVKFGEFMEHYKIYINNRDKYPMLKDYYPEMITWLSEL